MHMQKCLADTNGAAKSSSASSKSQSKKSEPKKRKIESKSTSKSESKKAKSSSTELTLDDKLKLIQSLTTVEKHTMPAGKNWALDIATMFWAQWEKMHEGTADGR